MTKINLICLPYAGGSAAIYSKWSKLLNNYIRFHPFEMAGRAGRHKEPFYDSLQEAVEDVIALIQRECVDSDYAVWGHSMGSIMAYELICQLQKRKLKQPVHVFFSGRYPPSVIKEERNLHMLSEPEFEEEAVKLGGLPKNLFRLKGLLKLALDTLRADYRILETYAPGTLEARFDFNISVLAGKEDELAEPEDMRKWMNYCGRQCKFYYFEGGHFYLHNHAEEITRIINNTLALAKKEVANGG